MKMINTLIIILCLCIQGCSEYSYNHLSGKCERAKKKRQTCLIKNVLLCEKVYPPSNNYGSWVDYCTNPDGVLIWMFNGQCNAEYENLDCSSDSSSNSSSSNNRNSRNNR